MELKYQQFIIICSTTPRFNRTFMELKFVDNDSRIDWNNRFNRTFMELKFM